MKDFCIVGSGIAGSVVAKELAKKYSVEIFDKARGPGGRSSNRRYKDTLSFDHGLQYFSPKSIKFKKFILSLKRKKVLKEWPGKHLDFTFEKKKKSIKYIGSKGNNDICKFLLKKIKTRYSSVVEKVTFKNNNWSVYEQMYSSAKCFCAAHELPKVEYFKCIGYGSDAIEECVLCAQQKVSEGWYPLSPSTATTQDLWRWAE